MHLQIHYLGYQLEYLNIIFYVCFGVDAKGCLSPQWQYNMIF
nr:MAG TPA: hypothetical protein [Caudoviricetes sp.]